MPDAPCPGLTPLERWSLRPLTTRAILLGALLAACSSPVEPGLSDDDELVLTVVPDLDPDDLPDDHATITSARVAGRTLFLTVQYGGGCETHRLGLFAGTELGESLPPYALLRLAHDSGGDPCDALLSREVAVDLSPIVPLVQQSGGTALRFNLLEPGGQVSAVGELLLTF